MELWRKIIKDQFWTCSLAVLHHQGKEYESVSEICQQQSSEEYRCIHKKKQAEWSAMKTGENGGMQLNSSNWSSNKIKVGFEKFLKIKS